jgi:hypothetical protein
MSMNAWGEAQTNLNNARKYVADIGREQRTTSKAVGKLHSLSAKTQIHFQYSDGDKNYHECSAFDSALSIVIKNHIDTLQAEAIALLESEVSRTGQDARASVQKMLDQIDAYETLAQGTKT